MSSVVTDKDDRLPPGAAVRALSIDLDFAEMVNG
jgi:hypothetical protein